ETKQKEFELSKKLESDLQKQIIETIDLIELKKDEASKLSRKLDSKQNEYNLTKSLVDNLEGFPESIRFLKKNAGWSKQAPLLSDVFFCLEEYRVALENFLEPVMNHYVVETQGEAVQAIKLLSDAGMGKANFFILNAIPQMQMEDLLINSQQQLTENLLPALNIITVTHKYRQLCELLLSNVYVLKSETEQALQDPLPGNKMIILSGTGKFSKSRIAMSGGSIGLFEGKRIGRAKNLENLLKDIKELDLNVSAIKNLIETETEKSSFLKSSSRKLEIENSRQEIHKLQNELISVQTKQAQYVAFIENSQNRKQDIEQKIRSINYELFESNPKIDELKTLKEIKRDELSDLQQEYNELAEKVTEKSSTYNQENIALHQQKNKVSNLEKDLEYRASQQTNLEVRISSNTIELQKVNKEIENTLQHVDHSDEDLTAMYVQKGELENGVKEAETAYYSSRALITDIENTIVELRRKRDNADLLLNEIKDLKNNLKLDLNALKERLSVEFSIDINDLLDDEPLPDENENELKARTGRTKKQLDDFGAINSMAMEAYQEMNERYSFIKIQKADLHEAKISLMQTIREIEETACDKFMDAFTKVREHFIHVFRSLFNDEDSCDLVLTDAQNPLESDIEILARPKGKRPLSINQLSGGEKTLTATALLFSLYLLKPAPFCIFDEVDAPLDDTNIDKFNNIIRKFSDRSQFIIVSHNKRTIASTDIIYGVTMVEQGVSRVVAVDIREVA
ncbi:MAG: chromosome segregation protein, partial [Daejeonella sp.]|nr:chromosome segregation protein [Daejeonella sp.]